MNENDFVNGDKCRYVEHNGYFIATYRGKNKFGLHIIEFEDGTVSLVKKVFSLSGIDIFNSEQQKKLSKILGELSLIAFDQPQLAAKRLQEQRVYVLDDDHQIIRKATGADCKDLSDEFGLGYNSTSALLSRLESMIKVV